MEAQRGAAPVAGQQRDRGGQPAARALPANRHPLGVDAQFGRVRDGPDQRRVAVLEAGRERVFRCQPVVHRSRYEACEPTRQRK
jgi:hypothetical protein